jgi:hypothetical protein
MYPYDLQFIKAETAYRTERAKQLMGPPSIPGARRLHGIVRDLMARHSSRVTVPSIDRGISVTREVPHHA